MTQRHLRPWQRGIGGGSDGRDIEFHGVPGYSVGSRNRGSRPRRCGQGWRGVQGPLPRNLELLPARSAFGVARAVDRRGSWANNVSSRAVNVSPLGVVSKCPPAMDSLVSPLSSSHSGRLPVLRLGSNPLPKALRLGA